MPAKLQSWARANPLMVLALAAGCGILAAELSRPVWRSGWLIIGAGGLLLAAWRWGRAWLLVAACTLVFAFAHENRLRETFHHPLRAMLHQSDKPVQAVIQGSLLPEHDMSADGRAHALCTTRRIEIPSGGALPHPVADVLVRLPEGVPFPKAGTYTMHGRLYLPRPAVNPGTFDARQYSLRTGRVARFDVDHLRRTDDSGQELWVAFLEAAESCRQWMSLSLTRDLEGDPETAAVIRAMALGVSAEADDEIEDAFRNSGTLHVFAVSGLHVALLGWIALILLRFVGVSRRSSLMIMLGLVFAYAFITGWRPSAARAAFMVAMFSAAPLLNRQSSLANSLGAAALLLLGWDTHLLFLPGFQLSFGVLWASSAGSAPLVEKLRPLTELDPFLPPQLASWRQRNWCLARRWLVRTFCVSFAAWAGSLPFILGHFQTVTPVAVVANCLLVPLSSLCLTATCLSLCAAFVHASGAQVLFNNLTWLFAKAMVVCAGWFAHLPGASFHFQPELASHAPASWRMLALPHGGAANHLRVGDQHWLFDTGNGQNFRHVLRPCLHSSGVDALEGVFLSHNDTDHMGALPQVMTTFKASWLFCGTQEPALQGKALRAGERLAISTEKHFPVVAEVLHPSPEITSGRGDDRAMVLMLHAGPWRVLWMSDAGWKSEKLLCASSADLRCDVLVRSQNEYDKSITTEFLLKASPQAILCGSDPRNPETALPISLMEFAKQRNIPLLDTWTDGSINLQMETDHLRITATSSTRHVSLEKKERAK